MNSAKLIYLVRGTHKFLFKPAFFNFLVYLRTKPATCLERIRARNRPEEVSIDLDYLNALHERHEEWLAVRTYDDISSPPVLIVDADQDKERVYTDTKTYVNSFVSDRDA
jgi:deoxyadenosine/deoxycytidine kinase